MSRSLLEVSIFHTCSTGLGFAIAVPAPGAGVSVNDIGLSLGTAALRVPGGPLPADQADDVDLPAELQALKQEAAPQRQQDCPRRV